MLHFCENAGKKYLTLHFINVKISKCKPLRMGILKVNI